jgi:hypothetical protein
MLRAIRKDSQRDPGAAASYALLEKEALMDELTAEAILDIQDTFPTVIHTLYLSRSLYEKMMNSGYLRHNRDFGPTIAELKIIQSPWLPENIVVGVSSGNKLHLIEITHVDV